MIFPVLQRVHELSHYLVLEPGDVINTGTPQGVALSGRFPYLQDGDEIQYDLDGDRAILRKAWRAPADDPFSAFDEWDTEADRKAYAGL
jgi:2-keto-4-pentenoate hydratase/2-oxohepta-3-ene-1,7-dioic acid hydratase in catechol pathway